MFLVEHQRLGVTYLVFTWQDPRQDGFQEPVVEGVTLDYDMEHVHRWPEGHARPEECAGRDPQNPSHYKVFKYNDELRQEGYQPVAGKVMVFGRWSDYTRLLGS
jgi:hypothetical protein